MINASILVSGGGANLQAIIDSSFFGQIPSLRLGAVISSTPAAHALERAKGAHIPTYIVERALFPNNASFCSALLGKLRDLDTDLVVTAGFAERLNYPLLHFYKNRVIGSQPALFPAFCGEDGFDPVRALRETLRLGLRVSGATAYFFGEEDDGLGPVIAQKAVPVSPGDTAASLSERIMREGEWAVLPEAIRLFCEGRLSVEGDRVLISE